MGKRVTVNFWVIMALVLVIGALWAVSLSPVFRIRDVVVRGNYFCSQQFLDEILDPDRLGNLFLLRTGGLRRTLEMNPWIDKVKLKRRFPDTLEVSIAETYPVAALVTDRGFILVNEAGVAVAISPELSKYGVPAVTCPALVPVTLGKKVEFPGFGEMITVMSQLRYSGLPLDISQANFSEAGFLTIYCARGPKIIWGELENNEDKLNLLQVIAGEEEDGLRRLSLVNLSDEAGPVIKYNP